jgi:pantothenate kinase type III
MILDIDVGNTSAKWRLLDGLQIVRRGSAPSAEFPCADLCTLKDVHRVRLRLWCSHWRHCLAWL